MYSNRVLQFGNIARLFVCIRMKRLIRENRRNSDRINEDICKKLARNLLTGLKCLIDCGVVHRELTVYSCSRKSSIL